MATNKILLIFGAGSNVASATADRFASKGYKVALVSRGRTHFDPSYLHIKSDLANPDTIKEAFGQVKAIFGAHPNVVIHNGT
jgi:NAD(P)-dependent dehydrogenase (short-subunit alcohol dehydrogenase family)